MNILLIPSWYPGPGHPLSGIFFKESAVSIGRVKPDWKIAVAVWGQRRYTLSLRDPFRTAAVLADFLLAKIRAKRHFLLPNVCEYRLPAIEWTKRWKQGNIKGQEQACGRIMQRAARDFGAIELIHAHVAFPGGWIAMRLSQRFRLPYIVTEHMGDFPFIEFRNADGSIKEAITEPLRRARALVAVSPSQAERIAGRGFPRPRVIPNMIDGEVFKPRASGGKKPGRFAFFSLAALRTGKGIQDLLKAAAILLHGLDDAAKNSVEFRIGGGGEEAEDLKAMGRELGIDPWLHWLGPLNRNQALEMFRDCDCFVLPSHLESFGMALLEALACGKPAIATRCGGPESMVTPENGILLPVKEPAALARAMASMLRGAERFDGAAIRRQCLERFSKETVTRQIEALYREALK